MDKIFSFMFLFNNEENNVNWNDMNVKKACYFAFRNFFTL